jgi:hypothetical protein
MAIPVTRDTKSTEYVRARVSMLLKWRASPDMLPFSLCNKKRLPLRHVNRPLFPTTLSIPPLILKVGRAKDLLEPPRSSSLLLPSLGDQLCTLYIWFSAKCAEPCFLNCVWKL